MNTYDEHNPSNPANQSNSEWDLDSAMEHAEKNLVSDAYAEIENELISRNMKIVLANQKHREVKDVVSRIEEIENELNQFGSLKSDERLELDRLKKQLYKMFK